MDVFHTCQVNKFVTNHVATFFFLHYLLVNFFFFLGGEGYIGTGALLRDIFVQIMSTSENKAFLS
jgi:hypothetical protein